MSFAAEQYFHSRNKRSWTAGNNVRHGWVNIQCIFCDDHSNHLGVNPDGGYSCWRCRAHGSILKLIVNIERCSYARAREIAREFGKNFDHVEHIAPTSSRSCLTSNGEVLPSSFTPILPKRHKAYIESRGYSPRNLIRKYKLGFIPGKWRNRIIIPIYMKGELVAFSGRDITEKNKPKYKLGNYKIERNDIIYNIDNVPNRKVVVVEGYSDCWRIGDGAIATMGTNFSTRQLVTITQVADEAFVLFDEQAFDVGEELADQLSGVMANVHHITIESNRSEEVDPDTLPPELIKEIRDKIWA